MKKIGTLGLSLLACSMGLSAQATRKVLDPLLQQKLQDPAIVTDELRHFLLKKVPALPPVGSETALHQQAETLRKYALATIYHGWPEEWINSAPKFERVGVIERKGYRIVKYRYEIVPGFYSAALLYEPEQLMPNMPAVLNVNGHGPGGKAVEHKQKRCINQARHGMLALSLEWIGFGELASPENGHNNIGLLDLAGANGAGLFYLAMRRGLDFLYNDPRIDRKRIAMTGLSGGGWQTMLLSTLDERIGPSIPVAGFSSLTTAIEHPEYAGDAEQNAPDMRMKADYAQLMTLRVPRPTLLIYNSMDDCCFRAGVVKQGVYDDIKPFYTAAHHPNDLQWYQNDDPGTHNYQLDSRLRMYRFLKSQFHLQTAAEEDPDTDAEVVSAEDLVVGLPKDNLTIVSLARKMAEQIHHNRIEPSEMEKSRESLRSITRFKAMDVTHAWPVSASNEKGIESRGYRFEFSNGLSATGVLVQSSVRAAGKTVILISDNRRVSLAVEAGNLLSRGYRVLLLDPILFGDSIPGTSERPNLSSAAQMLNTVGERPLGIEAAQIIGVAQWLSHSNANGSSSPGAAKAGASNFGQKIEMVTRGPRSEVVALIAAALEPNHFSSYKAEEGIHSLSELFGGRFSYAATPELACLDLYRDFDLSQLIDLAAPTTINLDEGTQLPIFWR
jgi:dienelactone hydrolase